MRTFVKQAFLGVLGVAAVACGTPQRQAPRDPIGGDPSPQTSALGDPTPQRPFSDPQPQKPLFPADDNQVEPQNQAKTAKLNDGQILAVARVANDGELQMAELARKNAKSNDVKQFAAMMISHHRDVMTKERQVQDKAKVQVEENDVSTEVKREAEGAISTLRNQSGDEFDRGYVDAQVRIHKDVLDTIDQRLLPNARSADVKSHLTEMRRTVASHLARAESLQKKLDPSLARAREDAARNEKNAKVKGIPTPKPAKGPDTSKSNTDTPNPHAR